jgi:ABC-type transporter Mla subunit MlaD
LKTLAKLGRISQIALRCAAIAFLCYLAFVIWPARAVIQETRMSVRDMGEVAREVKPQIHPAAKTIGIILRNAAVMTDEAAKASTAQQQYLQKTSKLIDTTDSAVASVKTAADTLNTQLTEVGPLLRSGKTAVDSFSFTLTNRVDPLLVSSNTLVNSSNALVSDPNLHSTVANFSAGSHSFALMADDSQRWLHGTLFPDRKPISKWRLAWRAIPLSGRVAEAIYYGRGALGK